MADPQDWLLLRWERDGYPMFVRLANAYRGSGNVPGYGQRAIVSIQLRNPTPAGMPSSGEVDDLRNFELNVCELLESENLALCTLVITGQGLRDIIFYTKDPALVLSRLEAPKAVPGSHKFQVEIEQEADWRLYRYFVQLLPSPSTSEMVQ